MEIDNILEDLKLNKISIKEAKKLLSLYSIEKIEDIAQIDINRRKRKGISEVIFAERKQLEEIKKIIKHIINKTDYLVISRINKKDYPKIISFLKKLNVKVKEGKNCTTLLVFKKPLKKNGGKIGIVSAGTSDIGVSEEARLVCESMNCECICRYDVGVAGLHRIFPVIKEMIKEDVDCIIVAAGMEGALATLVSTLTDIPVIGIPTSVGYGYGEKGVGALASMLQSCSLGLSVVNIDNGVGAGAAAANIANRIKSKSKGKSENHKSRK